MRRYFWDTDRHSKPHWPSFCASKRDESERKDAVNQNKDEPQPFTGPLATASVVTLGFF